MKASLRTLLTGVIDYAGLFPPAKLPLDEAIRNYARYRSGPEGWMLGRFICPAAQLWELNEYREELFLHGPALAVSVLGRPARTAAEFLANLDEDLRAIRTFRRRNGDRVLIDTLEQPLPEEFVRNPQPIHAGHFLVQASELTQTLLELSSLWAPTFTTYYEAPFGAAWRREVGAVVTILGDLRRLLLKSKPNEFPPDRTPVGFKLRCGGVTAAAFPSTEQIAFLLHAAQEEELVLKATAGLHHPLRRFDGALRTMMHGFLNLLFACTLSHAIGVGQIDDDAPVSLTEEELRAVLEDANAANFVFMDEEIRYGNPACPINGVDHYLVNRMRRDVITSFGSCSFDEPRDDLRALGLL